MNLKEANKELEKLENEYNYWLREKEQLLVLLGPRSTDIREEKVDGGKRVDRLYKYIELEDEKKINATLDYIAKRKENLFVTVAIIKPEAKLNRALNKYKISKNKEICPTASKSIPVSNPSVIISVNSDSLLGPTIDKIELIADITKATIIAGKKACK